MTKADALRRRAQRRYDLAAATLTPLADGSFDKAELVKEMGKHIPIDVEAMQRQRAEQDLELLERDDLPDDDGPPMQFTLPGINESMDWLPKRLILGPDNTVIEADLAPTAYVEAEAKRAIENANRTRAKAKRKEVCPKVMRRWATAERRRGRPILELTWGNCLRETGRLHERPGVAA